MFLRVNYNVVQHTHGMTKRQMFHSFIRVLITIDNNNKTAIYKAQ